jgi:hypothetical protein
LKSLEKVFEVEIITDIELESFDSIRKNIFVTSSKEDGKILIALYLDTRLLFYSCTSSAVAQWTPTGQLKMDVNIDGNFPHLSFKHGFIFARFTNDTHKVVIDMDQMLSWDLRENDNSSRRGIYAVQIRGEITCLEKAKSGEYGRPRVVVINYEG